MTKPFLKIYFLCFAVALAGALFFAGNLRTAKADGPLELIMTDPLFKVTNALPGQSFSSDVTLLNHGGDHEDFQFEIDMKTNPQALAERLFFKVTDGAGVCLYGCDSNVTLSYLDHREPNIARVNPHSTTYYKFIITFDPTAGNEFQSASTTFDMKLGFEGTTTTANGGGGPAGGGAPQALGPGAGLLAGAVGGVAGEAVVSEEAALEEQIGGAETVPEEGQIEGAETSTCQSWPKWIWILALIVYLAAFLWRTFDKIKEQIEKREIRWKWQAVLASAAFLFWYFFDFCREYWWFVIIALVGGAAVYLFYLYLIRKHIRETREGIESGSEQKPPENPSPPQEGGE